MYQFRQIVVAVWGLLVAGLSFAQGTLFIHGGGVFSKEAKAHFIQLAGGSSGHLVVIPTAGAPDEVALTKKKDGWIGLASVTMLHATSRREALNPAFADPLKTATAVWISGGKQTILSEIYRGTPVEAALYALLQRGGVIGGSSAGAGIMTQIMPVKDTLGKGFDLLPGCIVDQHFGVRQREARLINILQEHPQHLGIGIDENTAAIVRDQQLRVLGASTVTLYMAEAEGRPALKQELRSGQSVDLQPLLQQLQQR